MAFLYKYVIIVNTVLKKLLLKNKLVTLILSLYSNEIVTIIDAFT